MDRIVSVEGHGPMSSLRVASRGLRLIALAALAAALTACGGGGGGGGGDGGGGGNPPPPETGQVTATVVEDLFSTPISGALITVTAGTTTRTATTAADGTATVTQVPVGSVNVTAEADGFIASPAQGTTVNANATASVNFRLDRLAAEAAGGVLEVLPVGSLDPTGRTYTFSMRVVVVDQNFNPVFPGLTDPSFTLENCRVVQAGPLPECIRGQIRDDDRDYDVSATPPGVQPVDAGTRRPYAATMLLDQSGSIGVVPGAGTDPTDARVFSTKVFLEGLGGSDSALLAAFASPGAENGTVARIPETPVTFYPCTAAPCLSPPQFTSNGTSLFPSVDQLAGTEGGGTPMYEVLETVIHATHDNAPTGIANQRLAVVMFSDGMDSTCGFATCVSPRQHVIDLANGDNPSFPDIDVDLFTVGLSDGADSVSLAELAIKAGGTYLFAENANQLIPIYGSLGALLSDSLPTYRMTWTVIAQEDDVFIAGRSLIGTLTVNTGIAGADPFELRFIAPIFQL